MILPAPGPSFAWRNTAHGPSLVCQPLDMVAPHLFTTKAWALGASRHAGPEAWADIAAALGADPSALVRARQVHGSAVLVAEDVPQGGLPDADIVLAAEPGSLAAVQGADCVPLLMVDSRSGRVAAAHAGWRGMVAGVPKVAVLAMQQRYGTRPADIVAALGPSVGACCYEVGPDVEQAFAAAGFGHDELDRWFARAPRPTRDNPSMPGLPAERREGHWYFDGWAVVRDQLAWAGVPDDQIFTAGLCTASHPEVLCSYRRDGTAAGRIAGVIRASSPRR